MAKQYSYGANGVLPSPSGRYDWNAVYVYEVNPYAANYDSPGRPILWMAHNPFTADTDSYKKHRDEMIALANRIAKALTAQEIAKELEA